VKRLSQPQVFYSFLGAHSLLIGLLPFYLPVFLWGEGFQISHIALLIAATAAAFTLNLRPWQRMVYKRPLRTLLWLSFALECLLVFALIHWPLLARSGTPMMVGVVLLGALSGSYNAWFWTTQRTLFLAMTQSSNTGRQYGNFQIFVTVFLKVGILVGGLLIDANAIAWILWLSVLLSAMVLAWYHVALPMQHLSLNSPKPITLSSSFTYRDTCRSFPIFLLDGLFLFLESHFWLLSLFLVVREDYSTLGVAVVALAVFFAVTFWLLKNTIDSLAGNAVYLSACAFYALSWICRAAIDADTPRTTLLIGLMLITFCSSFFRLAFNKRFFDIARTHGGTDYLLVKSYVSQCVLCVAYAALGLIVLLLNPSDGLAFLFIYIAAAVLSLGYALYQIKQPPISSL